MRGGCCSLFGVGSAGLWVGRSRRALRDSALTRDSGAEDTSSAFSVLDSILTHNLSTRMTPARFWKVTASLVTEKEMGMSTQSVS